VSAGAGPLARALSERLKDLVVERSAELLPAPSEDEQALARLEEEIAELKVMLPRLAIRVREEHLRSDRTPDPAAESAILATLRGLGFPIAPVKGEADRSWLDRAVKGEADYPGPSTLEADLVLAGEGFSEYAGRVGRFVSCRARLEIRVHRVGSGELVASFAESGAAVDLSEHFAGKKALESLGKKAALALALDLARAAKKP
jgi:hypothetical protein